MKNKIGITGLTLLVFYFIFASITTASTLIVYPDGSGEYANIQAAINAAADGDTVALADGVFTGRGNRDVVFHGKAIVVCSQSGNPEACIINVQGRTNNEAERGFIFEDEEGNASVLRDVSIINGSADGPCPACEGGGIYIEQASPTIINVIFRDNYASTGAGIACVGGSPVIKDCIFYDNEAFHSGGLYCLNGTEAVVSGCLFYHNQATLRGAGVGLETNCTVSLVNCTISNNQASMGAGIAAWESDFILKNTIIAFSYEGEGVYMFGESSDIAITYSDIYGNTGGDWIGELEDMLGVDGNINADPLFVDTTGSDYRIAWGSPCIDTGDPNSGLDPDSTQADMGAYFYDHNTGIDDPHNLPQVISLHQNYPNPFNASTAISFELDKRMPARLEIYDILGNRVTTLVDGILAAGRHQVTWHANVATGIYFYRLTTNDYSSTKKMLLVK